MIREFETAFDPLALAGKVIGGIHSSAGQEAVAVGAMRALLPEDKVAGSHRSHHHALARGLRPPASWPSCTGGQRASAKAALAGAPARSPPLATRAATASSARESASRWALLWPPRLQESRIRRRRVRGRWRHEHRSDLGVRQPRRRLALAACRRVREQPVCRRDAEHPADRQPHRSSNEPPVSGSMPWSLAVRTSRRCIDRFRKHARRAVDGDGPTFIEARTRAPGGGAHRARRARHGRAAVGQCLGARAELAGAARTAAEAAGDEGRDGGSPRRRGSASEALGNHATARLRLEAALAQDRKRGAPRSVKDNLRTLARIAEASGNRAAAASLLTRSARIARRIGDAASASAISRARSTSRAAQARPPRARSRRSSACSARRRAPSPRPPPSAVVDDQRRRRRALRVQVVRAVLADREDARYAACSR